MTIASEANRSGPYACNGATTRFPFAFKIYDEAHIRVILTDPAGLEANLTLGTHYTVTGVGNDGGGAVVTTTAPPAGNRLTLVLDVPFIQATDLENQGAYFAETIERSFDLLTQQALQLKELIARSVVLPVTSTVSVNELVTATLALAKVQGQMASLAGIASDIVTVAGISADVVSAQGNAQTATTAAAVATTKAGEAAASAVAAQRWDPTFYSTTTETAALISAAVADRLPHLSAGLPLPTTNIGPIWHDDYAAVMTWRTIGSYTGYASINIGEPSYHIGSTPRAGTLGLNGAAISRTAYAALYALIGTTYGVGDAATTFNLPDDRGYFRRGWDHGRGVDSGRAIGSYQVDAVQDHYHLLSGELPAYTNDRTLGKGVWRISDASSGISVTRWLSEGGDPARRWAAETRPKNRAYLSCIKF